MKASDWISVNDKLPKQAENVLVCREIEGEKFVTIAAYVRERNFSNYWYNVEGFDIYDVTHWQPIVLPKKEKL